MMKPKVLLCAVALWSAAAFALPSTEAVQEAVRAGNYAQAETMMKEVVAAKPQSAKAHYIYAEILAHEARFAEAATQARLAREADPQITFTDPQQFRHFEQTLQREQSSSTGTTPVTSDRAAQHPAMNAPARQEASGGLPGWVWGLGIAAIAFFIWRRVSRRAMNGAAPMGSYGGTPYAGPGGGYGPGMQPGYGQPG